jgi:hypothetical protein
MEGRDVECDVFHSNGMHVSKKDGLEKNDKTKLLSVCPT